MCSNETDDDDWGNDWPSRAEEAGAPEIPTPAALAPAGAKDIKAAMSEMTAKAHAKAHAKTKTTAGKQYIYGIPAPDARSKLYDTTSRINAFSAASSEFAPDASSGVQVPDDSTQQDGDEYRTAAIDEQANVEKKLDETATPSTFGGPASSGEYEVVATVDQSTEVRIWTLEVLVKNFPTEIFARLRDVEVRVENAKADMLALTKQKT